MEMGGEIFKNVQFGPLLLVAQKYVIYSERKSLVTMV